MSARLVSVNLGQVATVFRGSTPVRTAFRKLPHEGPVRLGPGGLEGDEIGDRTVHGGPTKAVYAYPQEHYEYWTPRLAPGGRLPWGSFGENLTVRGLSEAVLRPGDRLEIGTAILVVTQPRNPCFKLGLHHHRPELVREFEEAARPGFYLGVDRSGVLSSGDPIRELGGGAGPTIERMFLE
jgi:MOSC domain-containing protein YiiM